MSVSLKQIRYFIAAAELGQISKAAVDLNVSQSAVTAAVQQLEATLGVPLLKRNPSGVSLTPEGNRFLFHGRNVMAAVSEAVRVPRISGAAAAGTVRVGVTYTVAGYSCRAIMPASPAIFRKSPSNSPRRRVTPSRRRCSTDRSTLPSCWYRISRGARPPAIGDPAALAPAPLGAGRTRAAADRACLAYRCRPLPLRHAHRRRGRDDDRPLLGEGAAASRTSSSARLRSRRCAAWWRPAWA